MPPTLSASIIVKNEAHMLAECLASVRPFVDEIVVCDGSSTDGSRDICEDAGAIVVTDPPFCDFSVSRQTALDRCSGEWVFIVDADEVCTGSPRLLRQEIRNAEGAVLRSIIVRSVEGRYIDMAHIFRRDAFRWAGAVHEMPWPVGGDWPKPALAVGVRKRRRRTSRSISSRERNLRIAEKAIVAGDADPFPGFPELMAALSAASLGRKAVAQDRLDKGRRRFQTDVQSGSLAQPIFASLCHTINAELRRVPAAE